MAPIKGEITITSDFMKYGEFVLNKADVAECNTKRGEILMRSGHQYVVPPAVLSAWFGNIIDFKVFEKKLEGKL